MRSPWEHVGSDKIGAMARGPRSTNLWEERGALKAKAEQKGGAVRRQQRPRSWGGPGQRGQQSMDSTVWAMGTVSRAIPGGAPARRGRNQIVGEVEVTPKEGNEDRKLG